jgi:hypothetical protein
MHDRPVCFCLHSMRSRAPTYVRVGVGSFPLSLAPPLSASPFASPLAFQIPISIATAALLFPLWISCPIPTLADWDGRCPIEPTKSGGADVGTVALFGRSNVEQGSNSASASVAFTAHQWRRLLTNCALCLSSSFLVLFWPILPPMRLTESYPESERQYPFLSSAAIVHYFILDLSGWRHS